MDEAPLAAASTRYSPGPGTCDWAERGRCSNPRIENAGALPAGRRQREGVIRDMGIQ